jgi:hypothetical protein
MPSPDSACHDGDLWRSRGGPNHESVSPVITGGHLIVFVWSLSPSRVLDGTGAGAILEL